MLRLFGTDGIRGRYGEHPITESFAHDFGEAITNFAYFAYGGKRDVVIGYDGRPSGGSLSMAVAKGVAKCGGNAIMLGVIPTPGVAFMTTKLMAGIGVSVSASHNLTCDNGFKLFDPYGKKVADEEKIEEKILSSPGRIGLLGSILNFPIVSYIGYLFKGYNRTIDAPHIKIVVDCANGATSAVIDQVINYLGIDATIINNTPGPNINRDCGSQHPEFLSHHTTKLGADFGFAFDGDGDRVLMVDGRTGIVLTGNTMLSIFARYFKDRDRLHNNSVVTTILCNLGISNYLGELGINNVKVDVGDKYVAEKMDEIGACLGGEDSGHLIIRPHTTGDGVYAFAKMVEVIQNVPIFQFIDEIEKRKVPKTIVNVDLKTNNRPDFENTEDISSLIKDARNAGCSVVVRYSGTENVARVMVQMEDSLEGSNWAHKIARRIDIYINGGSK